MAAVAAAVAVATSLLAKEVETKSVFGCGVVPARTVRHTHGGYSKHIVFELRKVAIGIALLCPQRQHHQQNRHLRARRGAL